MPTRNDLTRAPGDAIEWLFEPQELLDASDAAVQIRVRGETFPRVLLAPVGEVRVGDGTIPPVPIGSTGGGTNLGALFQLVVASDSATFASINGSNVHKCDGTNDEVELNAAFTAAAAAGGFVQWSDGHFHVKNPVLIPNNVTFEGRNRRSTVIVADQVMGGGFGVLMSAGAPGPITSQVRQWKGAEFSVDGGGFNHPCLWLSWTNSIKLTGFQLKNSVGQGLFMEAFWDSEVDDFRIDACGSQGAADIASAKASMEMFGTSVTDNCNNLVFRRGTIEHTTSALSDMAIKMVSGATANEQHNKITFDQFKVEHHTVGNVPVIYAQGVQWLNFEELTFVVSDFMSHAGITNTRQDVMTLKNCSASGVEKLRADIQTSAHQTTHSVLCFDGGTDCYVEDIKVAVQSSNFPDDGVIKTINAPLGLKVDNYGWMFDPTPACKYFNVPTLGKKTVSEPGRRSKVRSDAGGQGPTFITASTVLAGDAVLNNYLLEAYETGFFRGVLIYSADVTPDFKFSITMPSGVLHYTILNPSGLDITAGAAEGKVYESGDVVSLAGVTGVGTKRMVILQGTYEVGATRGNTTFTWAQNTSDAGKAQIELGSRLMFEAV